MPQNKEPRFFIYEGETLDPNWPGYNFVIETTVTDLSSYKDLFAPVSGEIAIGEATAGYLTIPEVPDRILKHIPKAKFIAILRDPADRAYSAYLMDVMNGLDDIQLALVVKNYEADQQLPVEIRMRRAYASYIRAGFYYQGLKRYYQRFGPHQLGVFFYEDFKQDPEKFVRKVFGFLEIDQAFQPNFGQRYNVGRYPRHRRWHALAVSQNPVKHAFKRIFPAPVRERLSQILIGSNLLKPPPLSLKLRSELIDIYRQEIHQLQDLFNRDLGSWLKV